MPRRQIKFSTFGFRIAYQVCLLVLCWKADAGIPLRFQVLQADSHLNLSATLNFKDLGVQAKFVGQGDVGLGNPILSNGLSSRIGGWISAYVSERLDSYVYSYGTIFNIRPSGEWLPNSGEFPLPTDIGAFVDLKEVNMSGQLAMALRYYFFGLASKGVQSLTKLSDIEYQMSGNDLFYNGTPGAILFEAITQPSFDLKSGSYYYPYIATENQASPATLNKYNSIFVIQQPLDALWSFDLGSADNVGNVSLDLQFQGEIVAYAFTPEQKLKSQIVANLDPLFVTSYDPDIPNSDIIPHATLAAVGRGEVDYYSFTVTKPGTLVAFQIVDASFFPLFEITDLYGGQPPHKQVQSGDSSEILFSMPGTYVMGLRAYDRGENPIPPGASYKLHVLNSAAVPEVSSLLAGAILFVIIYVMLRLRKSKVCAPCISVSLLP